MCLAQERYNHNAVTPVRLEPTALQSRVKHSTIEPLLSPRRTMSDPKFKLKSANKKADSGLSIHRAFFY